MARDVALLFAPPLPPVRVETGAEITMGRSPACTLALPSAQASRHHAVVRAEDDAVIVEDLGSTNGTFVNGLRLTGTHRLEAGDRIQVGDAEVTFCWLETEEDPSQEIASDVTMLSDPSFARAPEVQVLQGDLNKIPFFAVLQMLELGGQRGRLSILGDDGAMSLWLDSSRLVHALTEKESGIDAAVTICQLESGRFQFSRTPSPRSRASTRRSPRSSSRRRGCKTKASGSRAKALESRATTTRDDFFG